MFIQGATNPQHVIQVFLQQEYAFSISCKNDVELRVAHCKGVWQIVRMKGGEVHTAFLYGDDNCVTSNDSLTKSLVESIRDLKTSQGIDKGWAVYERDFCSFVLSSVLPLLGATDENVERIDVLQPGRNASINEETGEFLASPRPNEWKS